MSAEDNLNKNQLGRWIPNIPRSHELRWHLLAMHKQMHEGPSPDKYDNKGWNQLHDQLHAEGKVTENHQHFTPKKRK
jgi:hypothetical protein